MKQIKVFKGMQFDGFDGKNYEVDENATIEVDSNDVNEFLMKAEYAGITQVLVTPSTQLADDLFLFRLATLIDDEDLLFANGTFTWLDDIHNMTINKVSLSDPIANQILVVLSSLLDWLNSINLIEARDIEEVDVLNTQILDAGYELYKTLVERMLT